MIFTETVYFRFLTIDKIVNLIFFEKRNSFENITTEFEIRESISKHKISFQKDYINILILYLFWLWLLPGNEKYVFDQE